METAYISLINPFLQIFLIHISHIRLINELPQRAKLSGCAACNLLLTVRLKPTGHQPCN